MVQPLWKTVWRILRKLKIELPYDPAIPLLSIYLKKMKSQSWGGTVTVHCSTIHNRKGIKTTRVSTGERRVKQTSHTRGHAKLLQSCLTLCDLKSARLLCPWDSSGRNTGVDCHFLFQGNLPNPGIESTSLISPALTG